MIIEDLSTAEGPSAAVLKQLERLGRKREALAAVEPADPDVTRVLARAHAILDDMEETLCEEGARSPALARGWEALRELDARLAQLQPKTSKHRRRRPAIPPTGSPSPQYQGGPHMLTTAVETLRSVAHRAAQDPQPGTATARPPVRDLAPRLAPLGARLFATGMPVAGVLPIVAQALDAFLPLLEAGRPPTGPRPAGSTVKTEARIDLLRQERAARRAARARERHADPAIRIWDELLGLTSEALEIFITHGDARGVGACAALLDLLADALADDRPEAA